ncbi:MAG TPA: type II CAAX endopeptidase family protein [Roseiflexaceae bacterium]|nr:type II CAAX endopeptidase family protein [Roseiflexaceae bacterium]
MMTPAPTSRTIAADRNQARRGLLYYFAVLLPLSALLEGLIIHTDNLVWVLVLMWVPTLASVVARLTLREGFADVSFRLGGRRGWHSLGFALSFPIAVGLVAYGAAWASGLAQFVGTTQVLGRTVPPLLGFAISLVLAATIEVLPNALLAAGEEIGWRGYMLTRLIDAGVPQPVLASGLIWGLWHVPLILAGIYAAGPLPLLSAALFMGALISVGYVFARLRLASGSVWPAIALHGAWNSVIQGPFDGATAGAGRLLWTGESGILVVLTLLLATIIVVRRPWPIHFGSRGHPGGGNHPVGEEATALARATRAPSPQSAPRRVARRAVAGTEFDPGRALPGRRAATVWTPITPALGCTGPGLCHGRERGDCARLECAQNGPGLLRAPHAGHTDRRGSAGHLIALEMLAFLRSILRHGRVSDNMLQYSHPYYE